MSTRQKQIRDLVLAAIQTATSLTSESIFRAPRRDIPTELLPAVLIYSHSDVPVDPMADQRYPHERAYTLRVELRVAERVEDDATDALAADVRRAVLTDDTLGGVAMHTSWANQQWDGVENEIPESGTALDFTFHYVYEPE